jgi:hypothetical protein
VVLGGTPVVGGGVSTFYSSGTGSAMFDALSLFYAAIGSHFPSGMTMTVEGSGDLLDSASGELTGAWSKGANAVHQGGSGVGWVAGVGGRVVWRTAGTRNGRRVKGSTFLVPYTTSAYDQAGTLGDSIISTTNTAATALIAATTGVFCVWSRPSGEGATDGFISPVIGGSIPDKVSWLRSRRT